MSVVGIDISKADFHACLLLPEGKRFEDRFTNAPAGFRKLRSWLRRHNAADVHACMESTGPYWRNLARSLDESNIRVSVVNPSRTVHFARSQLRRTKTDRVDARMLADFCASQRPERWQPERQEILELRGLLSYRYQLIKEQTAFGNVAAMVIVSPTLSELHEAHLQSLKAMIAEVTRQIRELIARDAAMSVNVELLTTAPGIGMHTAAALLAYLPVERLRNAKAAAAFVGVTPGDRQSGTSVHGRPKMQKTGSAAARHTLYMAALAAMRKDPRMQAFADRLRARGKAGKQIIVAVMHKLVRQVYSMLKNQTPFRADMA